MIRQLLNQPFSKNFPKWFRRLNACILLPILLYPLVFYTTIFLFDNPGNLGTTYLLFLVINIYPVYLITLSYFNSLLFQKNKILGSIFPSFILVALILGIGYACYMTLEMGQDIVRNTRQEEERAKRGYIGVNDDFKILDNKVYRHDTLIANADAKTFEIIGSDWQRDKNYYYYFGKKIEYIDRKSFENLDYHYSKDKLNVYYDEEIIEGADPNTFIHISGTQDGKDKNCCYRWGERVDCSVLLTEE